MSDIQYILSNIRSKMHWLLYLDNLKKKKILFNIFITLVNLVL